MAAERLTIHVDAKTCVGSRLCQMAAPEVFDMDTDRGVAVVRTPEINTSEEVWDAMEGCPREAIGATDATTGEQLFP